MPVVNPGIRRLLASAIQRLFNGASFSAPLTHSAIPTRAASGTTGTFTRATASTWRNNDGYMVTGVAGEIGFVGARRVRNLLTFTEDFSNAVWSATGLTKTATTLTEQATSADHSVRYTVASGKNVFQIKVKPNGRTRCALASTGSTLKSAIFNLTTASVEGALTDAFTTLGDAPTITLQSDGYYLLTMGNLSGSSTLVDFYMLDETSTARSYAGDITKGMFLKQAQLEDVTAQTTQTAGEYVSVGVTSAPYYHGSMVDGVKCFATDINGAAIPSTTLLGYLAEGASTNLIVRSNELDNASWTKNSATISANGAVASDGTTSLDKIVEAAATSTHSVYQTIAGTSGSYTVSVEMKQAERTWGFITEGNSVTATAYFNLAAGTVGTVSGTGSPSATITALANGAYRCTMTFTAGANANCQFGPATGNGSASYAGDITKGIYAGMVGFENNAFASSYIATTTVAVTRNADVLTYTGGDIPNLKTLMAGFRREVGVSSLSTVVALSDGTVNEYAQSFLSNATQSGMSGADGGAVQWSQLTSNAYTPGTASTLAWSAATNDVKMAKDGVAQTQDTSATVPTVTQLNVGHVAGGFQLSGNVGPIYGWTRNQSQSELNAVTQ